MLLNPSGKPNLKSKSNQSQSDSVKYFEARMFFNDLDNPEDYYLKVSSVGKNVFVRKDEVNE
jgi:hypothetical protein